MAECTIAIGEVLEGKYLVEGTLGEGAMGVVLYGRHQALNKRIAIKTLHKDVSGDAELISRFEQEARAASAIGHPNIVEVFDLGTRPDGTRYMVMEYLHGQNLRDRLRAEKTLTKERAGSIIAQILSALTAAHKAGIVHRDLKPENIFLTPTEDSPEFVKLLDFGISKVIGGNEVEAGVHSTRFGIVMGTPLYMSPEQASGQIVDHRTDIWSAGCMLYEMLCGRTPFTGQNYNQLMAAVLGGDLAPPRSLNPNIAPEIEAVILCALERDPTRRFQTAAEMREALGQVLGKPQTTLPPSAQPKTASRPSTNAPGQPPPGSAVPSPGSSQSGLAAAASGNTQNEEALLAALNRAATSDPAPTPFAQGVPAAQAAAPQQAPPVQSPPPAQNAPPSPPAPTQQPTPAAFAPPQDAFAPPQDVQVALDVDTSGLYAAQPKATTRRSQPVARISGGVAAQPPRRWGVFFLSFLLVVSALGAGGFAIYRYATLGYVFTPPQNRGITVRVAAQPAEVETRINGKLLAKPSFLAEIGTRYSLEFRAEGWTSATHAFVASEGKVLPVHARLYHTLPKASDALYPDSTPKTPENFDVDATLAAMVSYRSCLAPLRHATAQQKTVYTESTAKGPRKISKKRLPKLLLLDRDLLASCKMALKEAPPQFRALQRVANNLQSTLVKLNALSLELKDYYDRGDYQRDRFKKGKRQHRVLLKLFSKAEGSRRELTDHVISATMTALANELISLERHEKRNYQWHARNAVLTVYHWIHASPKDASDTLPKLVKATSMLGDYLLNKPADIPATGEDLRTSLEQIAQLSQTTGRRNQRIRDAYNVAVDIFNKQKFRVIAKAATIAPNKDAVTPPEPRGR